MVTSANAERGEGRRLHKPNNVVVVPVDGSLSFFKWWCVFQRPIINLTDREIDVVSELLRQRWELSKVISDPAVLDTMVMSDNTKRKVMESCGITQQHLYVILSNLRKSKVIVNNTINPRLVPNMRQDDNGCFQLLILFKDGA